MGVALKLRGIGNSVGAVFPKEVLARLRAGKGDTVFLTESPDGYVLTAYDETFARHVEAADEFMREYRDVLRELAK